MKVEAASNQPEMEQFEYLQGNFWILGNLHLLVPEVHWEGKNVHFHCMDGHHEHVNLLDAYSNSTCL